ncbi:reverse transcriptase domain-containing protein [Tanacetum coccineum]
MPVTRHRTNDAMTLESIQAMIDRAIQRNSTQTQDDDSQNSGGGIRRPVQPARVCTYSDFMKCQPLNFKGTEGVVGLSQWLEKMESVFHISGCAFENQVKFATCTLLGAALTWWNGHDLERRNRTEDLNLCALSATITIMESVHPSAPTARKSSFEQRIVASLNNNNQRTITCYECGNQGHYRSDCPVLKNQGTEARGMVYTLGGGETNQDLDNTKDDITA